MPTPTALTIAGSDSGGGAGIQADLKTFAALGVYGCSVVTALTAQNTLGVDAVETVSAAFVGQQLRTTISDIRPDAVKTGMLHSAEIIDRILVTLDELYPSGQQPALVVDPVMVSTSGHKLLADGAIDAVRSRLAPRALLLTPNLPEAKLLAGVAEDATDEASMLDLARAVAKLGCANVLLKGGHAAGDGEIIDLLYETASGRHTTYRHRRLHTKSTHGTGCTLSAAVCAYLSLGRQLEPAVRQAIDYVHGAMAAARPIGSGHGPVDHLHLVSRRALPLPSPSNPTPFTSYVIRANQAIWDEYTRTNAFVRGLADGTLPWESYTFFLQQDYLFLKHYARVFALEAYKSDSFVDIAAATEIVSHIVREAKLHIDRCAVYGVPASALENAIESDGCIAYTRWVLDIGHRDGVLPLRVATAPCLLGYGAIGKSLVADPATKLDGPYGEWIREYAGDDFTKAVETGTALLERTVAAEHLSEQRLAQLSDIFGTAVRLEIAFFLQGFERRMRSRDV